MEVCRKRRNGGDDLCIDLVEDGLLCIEDFTLDRKVCGGDLLVDDIVSLAVCLLLRCGLDGDDGLLCLGKDYVCFGFAFWVIYSL